MLQRYAIELKWGLVFSLSMVAWMIIERLLGFHGSRIEQHAFFTMTFSLIAVAVYVLALQDARKRRFEGSMSYVQGLSTGLGVTIVVAILSPLVQLIIHRVISPDFFATMQSHAVATQKMTAEAAAAYFNLAAYMQQSFVFALIMGLITSAIVAFFTRSK